MVDEVRERRAEQSDFRGRPEHLSRLFDALERKDPEFWRAWRKKHPSTRPNLRGANLGRMELAGFDLHDSDLYRARLGWANLWNAQLARADLRRTSLPYATLSFAGLREAQLQDAHLVSASLSDADLRGARLNRARLIGAVLNGARLEGADVRGAAVAGASVWGIRINEQTRQNNLVVNLDWWDSLERALDEETDPREYPHLLTDDLETAHFISQIVANPKLTQIINAATDRMVLLLGRFTPGRKHVLRLIKEKLLDLGYAPVIFDFAQPHDRDLIETVTELAGLSRFVIADLTQPKSTPLETYSIVPQLMVPFASVIREGERPFSMFAALQGKYDWVLPTVSYRSGAQLVKHLKTAVVDEAEKVRRRLRARRRGTVRVLSLSGRGRNRRRA